MAASTQARGLQNFISDIRNSTSKEMETSRVEKELVNIRGKFNTADKKGGLNSYHKKKYVWKLVYIHMLGYDVDFGHMEIISLLTSTKYTEKLVGYVATTLLLRASDDHFNLVINSIKNDLLSKSAPAQCLALACVANMGTTVLSVECSEEVKRILVDDKSSAIVRKKAALCLLRYYRVAPQSNSLTPDEWAARLTTLLEAREVGVVLSSTNLLLGLASRAPEPYAGLVPHVTHKLSQLAVAKQCPSDYLYYQTPCPWLQVKLLKFLQYYPPPADPVLSERLTEVLRKILSREGLSATHDASNKSNADFAILFEAIQLLIHHGPSVQPKLRQQAMELLAKFISAREPNPRYVGLQTMARLAQADGVTESLKKHQATVLFSLKEEHADVSVRRRALDLLFVMCDHTNAQEIVGELLAYATSPEADVVLREELVLKVAILAEKYASDLRWYVDTVLTLLDTAGDFVSDDIWHRVVQLVTNDKALQPYAAQRLFKTLQPRRVHETAIVVAAYVVGEFGYLIAEQPGCSFEEQYATLKQHFEHTATSKTRCLMLTAYAKLSNLHPPLRPQVHAEFERFQRHAELELQQRACEYLKLADQSDDFVEDVLREMPAYADDRESALEKRLREREAGHSVDPGSKAGAAAGAAAAGEKADALASAAVAPPSHADGAPPPPPMSKGGDGGKPPASPPAAEPSNLLDLDAPPPAAAPPPPAAAAGTVDGGSDNVAGIDTALLPKMKVWFNALVITGQGVLFENDVVQVGCRHAYQGSALKLALYIANKSGGELTSVAAVVPDVPYLKLAPGPHAPSVAAGAQQPFAWTGDCVAPFAEAPEVRLTFVAAADGVPHRYAMRLPVIASCFCEPTAMPAATFAENWEKLAGDEREASATFAAAGGALDAAAFTRARDAVVVAGMKMGLVEGEVPGFDARITVHAAATFKTAAPAPGAPADGTGPNLTIGVLLRLEARPQQGIYRVTARARHGHISQALKNILKAQLA